MKFGTRGFSKVLISKIVSIFTWNLFFEFIVGFWGLLSISLKVVEIES